MKKNVEKIISKIKGTPYKLDESITSRQLMQILCERGKMFIRGKLIKCKFKKTGKILFVGKCVKIQAGKNILIGSGSTIHDYCSINGLAKQNIIIGKNFCLSRNGIIECTGVISELGESLEIGDNVGIAPNAFISVRGSVKIGSDTIIGPNVTIISENHNFSSLEKPIRLQGATRKGIIIGNNVWIGANVTILDGVSIGDNAIIGAGTVVNKDIPASTINVGVPNRVLRER